MLTRTIEDAHDPQKTAAVIQQMKQQRAQNSGALDPDPEVALFQRIGYGRYLATKLVAREIDMNSGVGKTTQTAPMHMAAIHNDTQAAQYLLDRKGNLNVKDNSGNTPLHVALRNKNTEMALWLIDQGANIHETNSNGKSPIYLASIYQNNEVIQRLKEKGVDVTRDKPTLSSSPSRKLHQGEEQGRVAGTPSQGWLSNIFSGIFGLFSNLFR